MTDRRSRRIKPSNTRSCAFDNWLAVRRPVVGEMMIQKSRWLSDETMVKNANIPFGLGWDIHVVSDYPGARPGHHMTTERLTRMVRDMTGRGFGEFAGISIRHEQTLSYVIAVSRSFKGEAVTVDRMIEVIAHESSHVADYMFSAGELQPCTETRAYTIDWLVGMAGAAVLPKLWGSLELTRSAQ